MLSLVLQSLPSAISASPFDQRGITSIASSNFDTSHAVPAFTLCPNRRAVARYQGAIGTELISFSSRAERLRDGNRDFCAVRCRRDAALVAASARRAGTNSGAGWLVTKIHGVHGKSV